jgi:hypothetical protein
MAPELLNPEISGNNAARASEASDMYAFAMVMITGNMISNSIHMLVPDIASSAPGQVPFHGVRSELVVFKVLKGTRPSRPFGAAGLRLTDDVWALIQACWLMNHEYRPKVSDVVHCLWPEVTIPVALLEGGSHYQFKSDTPQSVIDSLDEVTPTTAWDSFGLIACLILRL